MSRFRRTFITSHVAFGHFHVFFQAVSNYGVFSSASSLPCRVKDPIAKQYRSTKFVVVIVGRRDVPGPGEGTSYDAPTELLGCTVYSRLKRWIPHLRYPPTSSGGKIWGIGPLRFLFLLGGLSWICGSRGCKMAQSCSFMYQVAYGIRGEGLVWLIGAVVYLSCCTAGPIVRCRGQWMAA